MHRVQPHFWWTWGALRRWSQRWVQHVVRCSHLSYRLRVEARGGVFADSGAWETALLRLGERLWRSALWATLLPLSDNGFGERAAAKVGSLGVWLSHQNSFRQLSTLASILAAVGSLAALGIGSGLLVLALSFL